MKLLGNEVPQLGMGCWAIGGPFYAGETPLGFANVDDVTSTKTIHAAYDAGIRVFDTAAVYGAGHSERLLGNALKKRQDAIIISKLGEAIDEKSKQVLGADPNPANVEAAIDACLKRLQREYVDIMMLHLNSLSIDEAEPVFEEMENARLAGKLRAYGWSTDYPSSTAAMSKMQGFVGVEHAMSVFIDVPTIQRTVADHDLVAFIRSPLAMGILTGKFDQNSTIPRDDVRAINNDRRDYFKDAKVAPKYLTNLAEIRELLQTGGRSIAQGALGWLMAKSERNIPLPGARTEEQVLDNAGAISFGPLAHEVMDEIELLIHREPEGKPRAR